MRRLLALTVALSLSQAALAVAPERYVFPKDICVADAKRDFGAVGDGKADDSDALQKALDSSSGRLTDGQSKVVFVPNGTYRVTRTLVVKVAVGPWLYGESRDGTVIRLDDGVKGVTCVLRTHPNEKGPTSADWFMRNVRNLTFDAGDNPETDGVRWYSTNSGCLQNVRVIGRGKVGINCGFLDQNGPNLIQDVTVEGFETGILSQWHWSQTLSRVAIRQCREVGLKVEANVVSAEDLTIEGSRRPIVVSQPNDWYWWSGVLAIVNSKLNGTDATKPAIENRGVLFARDVQTSGVSQAIDSNSPGGSVPTGQVGEYSSHPARKAFDAASGKSLGLPIEREPAVAWESDPAKWVCVDDHGAKAGDNRDDTAAFQRAFDHAAKTGATTVYVRGTRGGDPNWYSVKGTVTVRAPVRRFLGLGFGRILGEGGKIVLGDDGPPALHVQNIDSFGGPPVPIENASAKNALVVESSGVKVVGSGGGPLFLTDCPAQLHITKAGTRAWCRHFNAEGDSDRGVGENAGGDLWVLGMKCEGRGVRLGTYAGGRTELLGAFIYGPGIPEADRRPLFAVEDAALSFAGLRELTFAGNTYHVKVRESRKGQTREAVSRNEHGWIGWSLYSGSEK